jgi:hypothetical protein
MRRPQATLRCIIGCSGCVGSRTLTTAAAARFHAARAFSASCLSTARNGPGAVTR